MQKLIFFRVFGLFVLLLVLSTNLAIGQEKIGPKTISKMEFMGEVPSLAQQVKTGTFIKNTGKGEGKEVNPKRRGANKTVPGKGFPKGVDPLVNENPVLNRSYQPKPIRVFDAHVSTNSDPVPSDPTGAVGPNHYIAAWNSAFRIFDKKGNPLIEEASFATLFNGNTAGDPIVLYDAAADRFLITQFEDSDEGPEFENGLNIAISQGADPVNDGWYVYTTGFETGALPDYPKYSIWRDGYYITSNIVTDADRDTSATGNNVFVLERDKLLQGREAGFLGFPLPGLKRTNFYSPQFFSVGAKELPQNGGATLVYLQDDSWEGVDDDHLNLWTVNVDWSNPQNSNVSAPAELKTAAFKSVFDGGAFENLSQPSGPDVDALQATIMNQAQFKVFAGYNSAVFNFVVNVAPEGEERAGIRWYELRQSGAGQPWSIFQEGTYASPDGQNAFAASLSIDKNGSIGMGFTTVSTETPIAINYTGRYRNDPLGTMSVPRTVIAQSTANNAYARYADYTHLTLDPVDEETFWYVSEYFDPQLRDVVGVFKLAPEAIKDVQVSEILSPKDAKLTGTEEIKITIRNAGIRRQGDFDVFYQIGDGPKVTERFTGSLAFNETAEFTFAQTADLSISGKTYAITASTALSGDQNLENDSGVKNITHKSDRDVGIAEIIQPVTKGGQTAAEKVVVSIANYGGLPQKDIPVYFQVNDGAFAKETAAGTLAPGETVNYFFNQTADLSALGDYTILAGTELPQDAIAANDTLSKSIRNFYCSPGANCKNYDDGVTLIELAEQRIETACSPDGYVDNTQTVFIVDILDGLQQQGVLQMGYENSVYIMFADFNNNGAFEPEEQVSSGSVTAGGSDTAFTLTVPENAPLGDYRLRIRGKDVNENGNLADPCGFLDFGRTTDFTLRLIDPSFVQGIKLKEGELVVFSKDNNQFSLLLRNTAFEDKMIVNVFSITGEKIVENRIPNTDGNYLYDLDMSYAAPGVYIVRVGTKKSGLVKKILVR